MEEVGGRVEGGGGGGGKIRSGGGGEGKVEEQVAGGRCTLLLVLVSSLHQSEVVLGQVLGQVRRRGEAAGGLWQVALTFLWAKLEIDHCASMATLGLWKWASGTVL